MFISVFYFSLTLSDRANKFLHQKLYSLNSYNFCFFTQHLTIPFNVQDITMQRTMILSLFMTIDKTFITSLFHFL